MKSFTVDGAEIAKARELAGLNQPQLARRLGVDQSLISHWEASRRSPSAVVFKRLCAVLGVRPEQLLASPEGEAGAA